MIFDINDWKKDLANEFKLKIHRDGSLWLGDNLIIDHDNNVNFKHWHHGMLTSHTKFNFDGGCNNNYYNYHNYKYSYNADNNVYLTTEEECKEFKELFKIMIEYFEKNWKVI